MIIRNGSELALLQRPEIGKLSKSSIVIVAEKGSIRPTFRLKRRHTLMTFSA